MASGNGGSAGSGGNGTPAGGGSGSGGGGNGSPRPRAAVVEAVHNCRLPIFWKASPEAWFYQVESSFACHQVRSDSTRYNLVVSALDAEAIQELLDVIRAVPTTNKYEYLKTNILSRFGDSTEARLRTLFTKLEVSGRTPSQLLRHMRNLAGNSVTDDVLKVKWLDLLPHQTQKILRVLRNTTLDELAEAADGMSDVPVTVSSVKPSQDSRGASPHRSTSPYCGDASGLATEMAALRACMTQLLATSQLILDSVTHRGNSQQQQRRHRSRSRGNRRAPSSSTSQDGYCYYHHRFGIDSERCAPPCTWKSKN